MPHPIKIATCCYCGSRTVLKPTARDGHELACASCGAPLHEMKWLKATAPKTPDTNLKVKQAPRRRGPGMLSGFFFKDRPKKKRKKKKRSEFWEDLLEDGWDAIEDIFD